MLVSLDVGTSNVAVIVAEGSETVRIAGIGYQPSRGLKRSMVVDIESAVSAIKRAVEEAELMADCKIESVVAGIGGHHIHSMTSHGIVAIDGGEVSALDVEKAIDAARAVAIPADQQILHVLPIGFIIDGQDGIREPLGMAGVRLEVHVHIIICSRNVAQNIEKCLERCGLKLDGLVANQMASGEAVLTDDEKELGVCLIDMGGGTLDIAVYSGGFIRHTAVVPIAGDQVTGDISHVFSTPTYQAEEVKIRYASALTQIVEDTEMVKVPSVGGRPPRDLPRQQLASIVQARYEELFSLVRDELINADVDDDLAAGIVITGGAGLVEGAIELAEELFHLPVRLAKPKQIFSDMQLVDEPIFSTSVGLAVYAKDNQFESKTRRGRQSSGLGLMRGWRWCTSWVKLNL